MNILLRDLNKHWLSVLLLFCFSPEWRVYAEQSSKVPRSNPPLVVILDSSASMGRLEAGVSHLNAVKDALISVAREGLLGPGVDVVAFGSRFDQSDKERSCADVLSLRSAGNDNALGLSRALQALEPKGYTSIARSFDFAATGFSLGSVTRIILITDGVERCGGDPVHAIRSLRRMNHNVSLDIIGLILDLEEKEALKALAEFGGGRLFEPKGMDQVATVLRTALAAR